MDAGNNEGSPLSLESIDLSLIENPELVDFLRSWLTQRNLNREIYLLLSERFFNYQPAEISPSVKDSLIYQIKVHDNYLKCVKEGNLIHGKHYGDFKEFELERLSSQELLEKWDEIDKNIIDYLSISNSSNQVNVPWSETPVSSIDAFSGLINHEIYHLGRNSVILEALKIPRPESLKKVWG